MTAEERTTAAPLLEADAAPIWLLAPAFVLGLLATVFVFAAITAWRAQAILDARLPGDLTVVASGRFDGGALETSDAAVVRAEEIALTTPGVRSAVVLAPDPADETVARLLGAPTVGADAGAPRLLAVRVTPGAPAVAGRLAGAMAQEGLAVAVDDHRAWDGPLARATALWGAGLVAGLLLPPVLLAALVHAAVVQRGEAHRSRLDLLARLGASRARLAQALVVPLIGVTASLACAGGLVGVALVGLASPHASAPFSLRLDTLSDVAALGWLALALATAAAAGWAAAWRRVRTL